VKITWGYHQSLHILFIFFILCSILSGSFQGYNAAFSDLNQLIRLAKYILVYTIALTAVNNHPEPDRERTEILKFVSYISLILCLICIQQYFDLAGLNKFYVPLISSDQDSTLLNSYLYPRAIGMVGNPNEVGFILVMSILSTYILMLNTEKNKQLFVVIFVLEVLALLSTASRGSLISAILGILFVTFAYLKDNHSRTKSGVKQILIIFTVLSLVLSIALANETLQNQLFWRFSALSDTSEDESWQGRDKTWQSNITIFQKSPILGVGPLRSDSNVVLVSDNEWLTLLRSYGVIGTIFLSISFIIPQFVTKIEVSKNIGSYRLVGKAVLLSIFAYMIPLAVYFSVTLMPIALILLALSDMSGKTFRKNS
jgi:O-antigen ligase